MSNPLQQLLEQYPLPTKWDAPAIFQEEFHQGGLDLKMVGLSTQNESGILITGSAAQQNEFPFTRSYFELLERVSLIEASSDLFTERPLYDASRKKCRTISGTELFPSSDKPQEWQFAKSNGVAAHRSWPEACRAASLELIERDRVLRSWYGQIEPVRVGIEQTDLVKKLENFYMFEAYLLPGASHENESVVIVVAFPIHSVAVFAYGFSADSTVSVAIGRALGECLQRISFLWGEVTETSELPDFSPTPDYHQEYFLRTRGKDKLCDWLKGAHLGFGPSIKSSQPGEILYVDLTPNELVGKITVVKAISPVLVPLTFGRYPSFAGATLPKELWIHPIA